MFFNLWKLPLIKLAYPHKKTAVKNHCQNSFDKNGRNNFTPRLLKGKHFKSAIK
jgi:hypothetical protein